METRPGRRRPERGHAGLTDADRLMLAFAAEQRFVLGAQLAALTGVDVAIVDGRLRALTAAGYLREARRPAERPAARQVTPAGGAGHVRSRACRGLADAGGPARPVRSRGRGRRRAQDAVP